MIAWLQDRGVTAAALESTGVYWIVPHEMLEQAEFEVRLVDTRELRRVPGRPKSDRRDCEVKSMHQRGLAYDLSGPDLSKIEAAVRKAVADGRIRLVQGSSSAILCEPRNNCVHVEIDGGLLDFEPFEYA
jgi:hypothetical protein